MDAEWLKAQFKHNPGKTQVGLARALGIDSPAVNKILSGQRQIKAPEYVAMRKFFGLPVDGDHAVSAGGGYVLQTLGTGLSDQTDTQEGGSDNWVMPAGILSGKTKTSPENIKIFAVQENSMSPDFKQGEHVLVDLSDRKPSPPGQFVISDGMGYIIRQGEYVPHSSPPQVRFTARSTQYEPYITELDKADIIGRIIARLEWL